MKNRKYYSVEKYQEPVNGYVYKKSFFIIKGNQFIVYNDHSIQCNSVFEIVDNLRKELYPDAEIKELALFLPHDLRELE